MTGFSTNDTIVIFDRVRENLRGMRRDSLDHVINVAINQTLGRTVITVGHGAAVVARAVLLRRRSAARLRVHDGRRHHHRHLLDVFIAAAIVSFWRGKAPTRAAAHAPASRRVGAAPQQPTRKSKPQRKARAS